MAEHIGTLDVLSGGRAEFGGGRATSQEELLAFGVDPAETQAQWEECLRMLPKMWTQETFEWDSPLIKIPPRRITPKPLQQALSAHVGRLHPAVQHPVRGEERTGRAGLRRQ